MRLTKSTDAAFRMLIQLAKVQKRQSAKQISEAINIPFNHTAKILQTLSKAGFVRTIKGNGGGVDLASHPADIRLDSVISAMEGPIHLMECTIHKDACPLSAECSLSRKIKEAQDSMIRVFSSSTIADLLEKNDVSQKSQTVDKSEQIYSLK